MKTIEYVVTEERIHARPAGLLVNEAGNFKSSVKIAKDGKSVDAKKLFGIMALGFKRGETAALVIEGEDEEQAAVKIEEVMKSSW